jgi:hypothetical protein
MVTALRTLIPAAFFALTLTAQTGGIEKPETPSGELRRLESVTWDLKTHTLNWTVQKGTEERGEFIPRATEHYRIRPEAALMAAAGEQRNFEADEAALLRRLLDTISLYCAQSVVWWEHGEGTRVTDDADRTTEEPATAKPEPPSKPDAKPDAKPLDTKPVRVAPLGVAEVAAHPALGGR